MTTSKAMPEKLIASDYTNIGKIIDRAEELGIKYGKGITHVMDLEYCHLKCMPLDFGKLLNSTAFDFTHDFLGIYNNFNRETKQLGNDFTPRCAK